MTDKNRSSLAIQVSRVRDPKLATVRKKVFGVLFHTTGGGVTDKAEALNVKAIAEAKRLGKEPTKLITPIEVALRVYYNSQMGSEGYKWGGPHYVLDHDGKLYQIAPDDAVTMHAGGTDRDDYRDGDWRTMAFPNAVEQWDKKWGPKYNDPYDIFPSRSPNLDYIGVEMIPVGDGFGGQPMRASLRFTKAQHDSCIALWKDIAKRHELPSPAEERNRYVGHEDVQLMRRDDKGGGWDPGHLREQPYFDFDYVLAGVVAP